MPQNPPEGYRTITPQAIVADPDRMITFITDVLGGELVERHEHDGLVMHAEIRIGDSLLMMGGATDEFPPFPSMISVYVDDVDKTYELALEHGARSLREPQDQFYGDRSAGVVDTQGNTYWLATHIEDVSPEEMQRRMAAR